MTRPGVRTDANSVSSNTAGHRQSRTSSTSCNNSSHPSSSTKALVTGLCEPPRRAGRGGTTPRPRAPQDAAQWPVPCARCGEHRPIFAAWPDGRVCRYCYLQAKRTRGTCACGHTGVLPGRVQGQPACRTCSGVSVNVDCRTCGAEDELYTGTECWRCVLAASVDELLTNPHTGVMTEALVPMAQALKSMKRANSGLTWIRWPHVSTFLKQLAVEAVINHAAIDDLPNSRTREYVRGLLVEHGALPRRDDLAARFGVWAGQAITRVNDPVNRDIVRRYIRWHHQRRMNSVPAVTQGAFLSAKQNVTVGIELLNCGTLSRTRGGGRHHQLRRVGRGAVADRAHDAPPPVRLLVSRLHAPLPASGTSSNNCNNSFQLAADLLAWAQHLAFTGTAARVGT